MYRGIPAQTVAWNNGTARSLSIFNSVDKSTDANVKSSMDNTGETIEMNRTDKKQKLKFSAKPVGTAKADALAIANDLPQKMDILTLSDSTLPAGTVVCDSASAKWSPENELTVDIEATLYIGKTFAAFS